MKSGEEISQTGKRVCIDFVYYLLLESQKFLSKTIFLRNFEKNSDP
ncbi:hypothetical protein LEP1GSC185_1397 [Leptospira licerasiae serovar Varillal str. VAR 010]|nr:hypothetical protein LEP1GSC185_1397 [Leptospira licerasiae serovar Varillal str. VAR 010]